MRISAIHIEGFGTFADAALHDLPSGLTVVLGDNEAGKSTLLAFIRTVLFGFLDGRSKENLYPPLRGGRHGGRITLQTTSGVEHVVERWGGARGGPVTVSSSDGAPGGEERLRELLGHTTRELFRSVYAFSLSELQSFETLQGDAVKAALYGASAGASVLALPRVQAEFDGALGEIFKPSGSKPQLNEKLQEFEQVRERLREALGTLDRYQQTVEGIDRLSREIRDQQTVLRGLDEERRALERLQNLWKPWWRLHDAQEQLAALPSVDGMPFPENGIERFERALDRLRERREVLGSHEQDINERREQLKLIIFDQRLIDYEKEVTSLREIAKVYEERQQRIPEVQNRMRDLQATLDRILDELGPGWSADRAQSMDRSLFTREEIRKRTAALQGTRQNCQGLDASVRELQTTLERAAEKEKAERATVDSLPPDTGLPAEIVATLRRGRDYFASVVRELPIVDEQVRGGRAELDRLLSTIDPVWNAETILRFDLSVAMQDRVTKHERAMEECQANLSQAISRRDVAETAVKEGSSEVESARQASVTPKPLVRSSREEILGHRNALRSLRTNLHEGATGELEYRRSTERLADRRRELDRAAGAEGVANLRPLEIGGWVFVVLGGIAGLAAIAVEQKLPAFVAAIVLIAVGIGIIAIGRLLAARLQASTAAARERQRDLLAEIEVLQKETLRLEQEKDRQRQELQRKAAALGLAPSMSLMEIEVAETDADAELAEFDRRVGLARDLAIVEKRLATATAARDIAITAVEECSRLRAVAEASWAEEVAALGLSGLPSPRTVAVVLLPRIDSARQIIRKIHEDETKAEALRKTIDNYVDHARGVQSLAAAWQRNPAEFLDAVDRLLAEAEGATQVAKQRAIAQAALDREARSREDAQRKFDEAEQAFKDAKAHQRSIEEEWDGWLTAHGFTTGLSEATALEALQKVGQILEISTSLMAARSELQILEKDQRAYHEEAGLLFSKLDRVTPNSATLAEALRRLAEDCAQAGAEAKRKSSIETEVSAVEKRVSISAQALAEAEREFAGLLAAASVDDEESFRRRAREHASREEILQSIAVARQTLMETSGETDLEVIGARLTGVTLEDIEAREKNLAEEIEVGGSRIEQLRNEKARLEQEMSALASSDDVARWRSEEERIRAEIEQLALRWGRYAIARYVLEEAKSRFERERQPRVLLDASRYLKVITDGRYIEVRSHLGAKDGALEIISAEGANLTPEILSRGTQEQLYLTLRFGYIVNHRTNEEPLPIVMDDILVNFDPARASRAIRAISELAASYQILLFTCHPWVAEAFRDHDPGVSIVRMREGKLGLESTARP